MNNGNKNKALVGTVIFHAALLMILFFAAFSAPTPTFPDPDGIVVDFGMDETGFGAEEPALNNEPAEPVADATPVDETTPAEEQPVEEAVEPVSDPVEEAPTLTQEDDSPTEAQLKEERELAEKKRKEELERKKREAAERKKKEEAERKRKEEEAARKALADKMQNAFGTNTGTATSQGEAGGDGNQGKTNGVAGAGVYEGGGSGDGYKWSLNGRGKLSIPQPNRGIQADGTVVVEIIVDKDGKVISARPGAKGTNTNNAQLYDAAKQAALRAKFTASETANERQKGFITYIFELQ